MKRVLVFILLVLLLGCTYLYREDIVIFLIENFSGISKDASIETKNKYFRNSN